MKLIITDDDKLVCQALKTIIESDPEFQVAALGHSADEAVQLYDEHRPDIALMDIRMEKTEAGASIFTRTGIDAGRQILEKYPDARILYLTTFADDDYIMEAFKIGAKGYLLKQNFDSILPALKSVSLGHSVFGDEIISRLPDMMNKNHTSFQEEFGLTDKEVEIMELVAEGLSNKEIALTSFLSEGTIRNYVSVILEKLQLRDRTQLAVFYYKHKF